MTYDAIIVGAGHNGLICACYLARAGWKVLVLERRGYIGGAVCTQTDLIPGCRIDVGSSVHIMFHLTPIARELELHRFGLEYLEMDPWAYYPVLGTKQGITFHRSVEATCESIAQFSLSDAETYRRHTEHWTELNRGIFETFLQPPSPGRIFGTIFRRNLRDPRSRRVWSSLESSRQLLQPYGSLIDEQFENEHVRSAFYWLAAQSGPSPWETATGALFGWNAMIHECGAKRAKGGSGQLTQALAERLKSDGGHLYLQHPVESIRRSGKTWTLQAAGQEFTTRRVVGACHLHTFFDLLGPEAPPELAQRVRGTRIGNGFGMMVRHVVSELPRYHQESSASAQPYHRGMQLLCPSRAHLQKAWQDYQQGRPAERPAVVAMTFSALDPSLVPPGYHTLYTWAQYHPYELAGGWTWDEIREREADRIFAEVCRYAPHLRSCLVDRWIQTPLDLERELGLLRGNVMHLEMSLDQMFFYRPLPELSEYRTSLPGIFLTGASTHPGGGVFGASGYNTARVLLRSKA